jgi:formate dehydrogenase subunit gamma
MQNMSKKTISSEKILRFRKSERRIHWAIAIPFMVCYATALILVIVYNPYPSRPFRDVFSWIHRISGIFFIILPMVVIVSSRQDFRVFFYNVKQAWAWSLEDLKFLFLMGLAAISKRISLPEQGKFNAAEKLNFMTLMSTYPLYVITGIFIWITDSALLSWLIHFGMAIIATPFLFGHLFMATLNPKTRSAISGMITGFVDRQYVKHHHASWYKEKFKK